MFRRHNMTEAEKHTAKQGEKLDESSNENDEKHEATPQSRDDVQSGSAVNVDSPGPGNRAGKDAGDRRGRTGFLVWLSLLLALAALGLASYPFWSQWLDSDIPETSGPSTSEFEMLAGRVDTLRQDSRAGIEALRAELDALSSELEREAQGPDAGVLTERIDQLSARIERLQGERNTDLGGLRSRLGELESEVGRRLEQFELRLANVGSNLDRADRDLATRLLLMEVDSLFAIARNNLVLGDNAEVALQAWERAMARLTTLEGAEFQALKESARREFNQLQDYRPRDIGMQIERLFGMADAVADWPVKTVQPGQPAARSDSGEGWRSRLGQVVGNLVRVESVDREFLGPGEIDLARERVRSLLQTAALALVRSRPDLARDVLDETTEAVRLVFDTDAANVAEALGHLEEIGAAARRVQTPELSDSRAEISRLLGEIR